MAHGALRINPQIFNLQGHKMCQKCRVKNSQVYALPMTMLTYHYWDRWGVGAAFPGLVRQTPGVLTLPIDKDIDSIVGNYWNTSSRTITSFYYNIHALLLAVLNEGCTEPEPSAGKSGVWGIDLKRSILFGWSKWMDVPMLKALKVGSGT